MAIKTVEKKIFIQKEKFILISFSDLKNATHEEREGIVTEMKRITSACWSDFNDVTYRWYDLADVIYFLKKDKEIIAFSSNKFVDNELIIFLSTMVLPKYQQIGVAKKMQTKAIKDYLSSKNNFFKKLYFSYRTPNPRIVKAVRKFNLALPLVGSKKITSKQRKIAEYVASIFSPDCFFDKEHFVIEGVFKSSSSLIYSVDTIPYSGDKEVDSYCDKYLGYKEKKGNLLVIVGNLNIFQKIVLLILPI